MVAVAGLLLAVIAVLLVLEPVLRAARGEVIGAGQSIFSESADDDDPARSQRDRALTALREIDFDRATGKLSDEDYQQLYQRYSVEAVAALRSEDRGPRTEDREQRSPVSGPRSADSVEALIARARASTRLPGARFCEECGAALEGRRRFCVECGSATVVAVG